MRNILLNIYTFFKGDFVGKDQDGNKFHKSNISYGVKKEKRWVIYKGDNDPTKIDPNWHAWLHHTTNDIPSKKTRKKFNWQKKITPNYTGTSKAYLQPGHMLNKEKKNKIIKNYESWKPNKEN